MGRPGGHVGESGSRLAAGPQVARSLARCLRAAVRESARAGHRAAGSGLHARSRAAEQPHFACPFACPSAAARLPVEVAPELSAYPESLLRSISVRRTPMRDLGLLLSRIA